MKNIDKKSGSAVKTKKVKDVEKGVKIKGIRNIVFYDGTERLFSST